MENKINIVEKFDLVYEEITRKKKDLDSRLAESIEYNLTGIFNLIRLQRNESGHPTGMRPDKDQMFANLTMFIMYCKTLYELNQMVRALITPDRTKNLVPAKTCCTHIMHIRYSENNVCAMGRFGQANRVVIVDRYSLSNLI